MLATPLSVKAKTLIPPSFSLVSLEANDKLKDALAQLIKKDIYSAPVRDGENWLGFLELNDIVHYAVKLFADQLSVAPTSSALALSNWTSTDIHKIQTQFDSTPVRNLINLSGRTPFHAVSEDAPLQDIVDAIISKNLQRVALLDAKGKISAVISPSSIVSYLSKHVGELDGSLLNQTIDEAKVGSRTHVKACTRHDSTIVAFAKIAENHISHLALEDAGTGILVGNISVKDIKLIQISEKSPGIQRLLDPVGDYVNEVLRMNLIDPPPVLHADVKDTVERTLQRLAIIRIHRLYLTDSKEPSAQHRSVGVVSLRDMLHVFASKK